MLLSNMTEREVKDEILSDLEVLKRKMDHDAHKQWRCVLKRRSRENPPVMYEYVSPQKNKWIYIIKTSKKGSFYFPVAYHYSKRGLTAYQLTPDQGILIFTGHFFTRFRERMPLDIVDPLDLLKRFFWV